MDPRVYQSSYPSIPVVSRSIFTHLFHSPANDPNTVGEFPASAPAYIDAETGTTISRAETKQLSLCLAYGLRSVFGSQTQRGNVVMIFSPNSLNWPVVLFGTIAAGLRCTLANSAYTPSELAFQYTDSAARLVFTSEGGIPTVLAALGQLGIPQAEARKRIIIMETGLEWASGPRRSRSPDAAGILRLQDLLPLGVLNREQKFDGIDCHETVFLCYSSGTTGKPKGVQTTHQNITTVLDITKPSFPNATFGVDVMLGILPFYHIYGAVVLLQFPFTIGMPVVIQSRFEPDAFCAYVENYKITMSLVVPPVLVALARHPAVDKYDITSLESLISGAAPLGASLINQVTKRLLSKKGGKGRFFISQGYGLTETSPITHFLPEKDSLRKMSSIGVLYPNLEARLVVDGDGPGNVDAKGGDPGELWVRGPSIMKGYLNNSKATRDAITKDGWFKTGDIAVRDSEGYYYIVDRRKELIKYKGFQVPPAELESVLLSNPDIADVAVIGVQSLKQATELPRAYVVHSRPQELKTTSAKANFERSVKRWIQDKVARHKFLRGGVVVIDVIPKSAAGKILRRELVERSIIELAGQDPGDYEEDARAKL